MRIRVSLGISFGVAIMLVAHGDDQSKRNFDETQSSRLESLQEALGKKDKVASKSLAKEQSGDLEKQLKQYEKFGPNQRLATSDFMAALVEKDFVDALVGASKAHQGQKISGLANDFTRSTYGIDLKFDEKNKTWNASLGTDSEKSIEKIRNLMKEKVKEDKEVAALWDSLPSNLQSDVAKEAISRIENNIKGIVPQDGQADGAFTSALEKKSKELGDKNGTLDKLKKEIKSARKDDKAERSLLTSQKKAVDKIKDTESDVSVEEFCKEFANSVNITTAIQRRLNASKGDDPCRSPLYTQLASTKKDRKLTDSDGDSELLDMAALKKKTKEEENPPKEEDPPYSEKEKKKKKDSENTPVLSKEAEEALKERDAAIEQMQQSIKELQEKNQALQSAYNMSQSCQRGMGTSKDPFGLNADNQRNEKMISSLKDEMEKVLVDNYTAAVCDQESRGTDKNMASRSILKSLGVSDSGALTASEQNTVKDIAQAAINQAGNFAKKKSLRRKLQSQIVEAASKKALTRLVTEYSSLINPSAIGYLRSMSHNDLIGLDGQGFGGALASASTNPLDYSNTVYQYNVLFESAMLDMKDDLEVADEYSRNADCAYSLAQTASGIWAAESQRMGALYGPNRQAVYKNLLNSATEIKNAPSSESGTSKKLR